MPNKFYKIQFSSQAEKSLDRLSKTISSSLLETIFHLGENPRPHGYIKLKGRDAYRIRVGDYRVIYEIIDHLLIIEVIELGHRKDVYK